ncbi:MAG TPA: hypothetical protein VJ508_14520 [Saprospiraceae bacterium]|nr:hypothetical protein [Saprospiraceae bacterium]
MKNLMFILFFVGVILQCGNAQSKFSHFYLYSAFSPHQAPVTSGLFVNREDPSKEFRFNLTDIRSEYHFGIRKNFAFRYPFFGTLGLEYGQQHLTYSMNFTYPQENMPSLMTLLTTQKTLTCPAGIGVRMKFVEVTSGLLLQYSLKSTMSSDHGMDIHMKEHGTEFGWYTGVALIAGKSQIGVRYQSTMSRYGSNLLHHGNTMELRNIPGNLMFTVGFSF